MDPTRIIAVGAMFAWAYFVALSRGDWIRSSQLLIILQQHFLDNLALYTQGLSAASHSVLATMPITGMYDDAARAVLQRALYLTNNPTYSQALLQGMPAACPPEPRACPANAGPSAAAAWAAASLLPLRDEGQPIWTAWHLAEAAAPQDVGVHLQSWARNFMDGVDTTVAHQQALAPEQVTTPAPVQVPSSDTTFYVPGQRVARATDPLWYWAVGTVAVVTVGVGLLFFPRRKRARGRV